jgi:hypothetical protein
MQVNGFKFSRSTIVTLNLTTRKTDVPFWVQFVFGFYNLGIGGQLRIT